MMRQLMAAFALLAAAASSGRAADNIDFEKQIQPIFAAHCVKCHGEAKAQGKMRLDSVAGIEQKLATKPKLLVAHQPDESELYRRLILPADSPKRMPKGGDPLPPDAIDLIARWIDQGAVMTPAAIATSDPVPTADKEPAQQSYPEVAEAPQASIDKLVAAGARVAPLCAGSHLLDVSFAGKGTPPGDAEVALLADVAEQVYMLNLADAKVSAAGLAPLATLKNLAWLHLERASASDDSLALVGGLAQLRYLNLYGTPITDNGLKHLERLRHLERLYLWQTKVSYDAAMSLEQTMPGLIVNLGFDHPEVVRRRLAKELEAAKKQLAAAKAETVKLEQQLKDAQTAVEAATTQLGDIEKQFKAVESPADGS